MKLFFRKPLVQFVLLGLILFGIQQVTKQSAYAEPIILDERIIEHLKNELENEWQVKPDSFILKIAKEKWIEQELLMRIAQDNELGGQSDLVRNAMIQTAEEYILSQVDLSEPSREDLIRFMDSTSSIYLTTPRIYFRQYFFGEDLIYAQKSLFDSKEIEIEGSEKIDKSTIQFNRAFTQVATDFGMSFSDSLIGKKANWRGIVPSNYGIHVVVIDSVQEAKIATLDEVKNQVVKDFRRQRLLNYRDSVLTELKSRTEIIESP